MTGAPTTYVDRFCVFSTDYVEELWAELPWEQRPDAPRRECWMNDFGLPYTYGRGAGMRTYEAQPWHHRVLAIRDSINKQFGSELNCCFINGYLDEKQHLGWHADDSPEISDDHPIAIISFGAERDIAFRPKGQKGNPTGRIRMGNGSLVLMHAGMQDTHEHKIPKPDRPCGKRISLTYRHLLRL